jgi:hypothetical protein
VHELGSEPTSNLLLDFFVKLDGFFLYRSVPLLGGQLSFRRLRFMTDLSSYTVDSMTRGIFVVRGESGRLYFFVIDDTFLRSKLSEKYEIRRLRTFWGISKSSWSCSTMSGKYLPPIRIKY